VNEDLQLSSVSLAQDHGYLALADICAIAADLDVEHRIIGGHMVSLLVEAYQVRGVPARETADADLAGTPQVLSDPRLIPALTGLGYTQVAGNRFRRDIAPGRAAVIDLLAPSYTSRFRSNQTLGDLTVDEVPGLSLALSAPPLVLHLQVNLSDGTTLATRAHIPTALPALALKAMTYRSRRQAKDAVDVWRLLEVARAADLTPTDWTPTGVRSQSATILREDFGRARAGGTTNATSDQTLRARIAALVAAHVGPPPAA
jgi:hypothetical protein